MRPYKIKHIPTGLYYKPSRGNNLSKLGKVYTTKNCVLNYYKDESFIFVSIIKNTTTDKKYGKLSDSFTIDHRDNILYKIPKTEFEIEYL